MLLLLIQQATIDEKIKQAPDNGYLIGVWIGYVLPFVILVALAWVLYYRAKKRRNDL